MRLLKDNCRSIRNLLPLHVGGDLDAGPARRVDEHLHHCLSCFREFRELAAMRERMAVLAEQQPPASALDHFTEEVMTRIALGERGPAAELPGVRRMRPSILVPLAAAATLMLGVMLGYLAQSSGRTPLPAAGSALLPVPLAQGAGVIPSEVRGSPVGIAAPEEFGAGRRPRLLDDFGVHSISPEQDVLIDSAHLPAYQRLRLLIQMAQPGGLSPEPGRQLRTRAPEPVPPQDG